MKWLLVEVCDLAFDRSSLRRFSTNPCRKVGGRRDVTFTDEVWEVAEGDVIVTPFGATRSEI